MPREGRGGLDEGWASWHGVNTSQSIPFVRCQPVRKRGDTTRGHTVHPLDETCSLLWSKTHAHTSFESFLEEMIAKKRRA